MKTTKDKFELKSLKLNIRDLNQALRKNEDAIFYPNLCPHSPIGLGKTIRKYMKNLWVHRAQKCDVYYFKFQNEEYYENLENGIEFSVLPTIIKSLQEMGIESFNQLKKKSSDTNKLTNQ